MSSPQERRITRFPGSNDTGLILTQQDTPRYQPAVPKPHGARLKRRYPRVELPPRLPLKINSSSSPQGLPSKRAATAFCQSASPWQKYQRLLSDYEAGPVVVAHGHHIDFPVVAIKKRDVVASWDFTRLIKVQHGNIVNLLTAFHHALELYLVYESLPVSLSDVQACGYGPLKEFEMATVCKEVCEGLIYVYDELRVCQPNLETKQILLSDEGKVKIANIGDCLLSLETPIHTAKGLGCLLFELMEPGTRMAEPDTLELRSPSLWGEQIQNFLAQTVRQSLKVLKSHIFLEFPPGTSCLVPYVQVARRARPNYGSEKDFE